VAAKTVTVLLSLEVVWQRVPDRRTHNSEGPTAECGEPVSIAIYEYIIVNIIISKRTITLLIYLLKDKKCLEHYNGKDTGYSYQPTKTEKL